MSGPFVCVPFEVLQLKLSAGAMRALLTLLSFRNKQTGQCNPGFGKLYERLGLAGTESDRRKLNRWLAQLRAEGILISKKRKFGGVVWYEFPTLYPNGTSGVASNGTLDGKTGAPYPLYEHTSEQKRVATRFPPQKTYAPTRKPTMDELVVAAYYRQQARKAAG